MAKLILLILGGFLAYRFLKSYHRHVEREAEMPQTRYGEAMVRCAVCGLYHPRSESLVTDGRFYCTVAHEQQARRRG